MLDSNLLCRGPTTAWIDWWAVSNISITTLLHVSTTLGNTDKNRAMSEHRKCPLLSLFSNRKSPSTVLCPVTVTIALHSSVITSGRIVFRWAESKWEEVPHNSLPTLRQHNTNNEGSKYRERDATATISFNKVLSHSVKLLSDVIVSRQIYKENDYINPYRTFAMETWI